MASFYAELHLEGRAYPVRLCHFTLHQDTDTRGRVTSRVRPGPLGLTLDVPDGDALLAWAAAPFKPLAGQVVFFDLAAHAPHETIAFAAGQCVGYHEDFASADTGQGAYVCHLVVTAPAFELRAGGPAAPLAAAVRNWAGAEAVPTPGLVSTPVVAPEYTLAEFTRTIWGADQVAPAVIEKLYGHFNEAKAAADPAPHWAAMQALVHATTYVNAKGETAVLNDGWPPAKGGFNKRLVQPAPPDTFDRYQKFVAVTDDGKPVLDGTFTSPIPGTGAFDFEARALEGEERSYDLMYEIRLLKELPFPGEESEIIPWHGHTGNGVQTRMLFPPKDPITGQYPWSWDELERKGYIKIIYKASPSNKFLIFPDGSTIVANIS